MESGPEFSCIEEYRKIINDPSFRNFTHYKNFILPDLLEKYPTILKDINEKNISKLPSSFCTLLLKDYRQYVIYTR